MQRWFDRREGTEALQMDLGEEEKESLPPAVYALLPLVPIVLVMVFSKLAIATIKMRWLRRWLSVLLLLCFLNGSGRVG